MRIAPSAWLSALLVLTAACSRLGRPSVPATPTATPTVAATSEATILFTPVPSLTPTLTPTSTPTLSPTSTSTPRLTATATAVANSPATPVSAFGDGTYIVGADITAGTYRAAGSPACFWARLSGFGGTPSETIANDFGHTGPIVTISPTDVGFKTSGCGTWTKIS